MLLVPANDPDRTPLGRWLLARIDARGLGPLDAFRMRLGVSYPTMNKWIMAHTAAVPEKRQENKIKDLLCRNREERDEFEELLEEQVRLNKEARARANDPMRLNREVAIKQLVRALRHEEWKHDEPPSIEKWLAHAAKIAERLAGQEATTEAAELDVDAMTNPERLAALSRRPKRKQ